MDGHDALTTYEASVLSKIQQVGQKKGNCTELQILYHNALNGHHQGKISSSAIRKMYAAAIEYAYPRK